MLHAWDSEKLAHSQFDKIIDLAQRMERNMDRMGLRFLSEYSIRFGRPRRPHPSFNLYDLIDGFLHLAGIYPSLASYKISYIGRNNLT